MSVVERLQSSATLQGFESRHGIRGQVKIPAAPSGAEMRPLFMEKVVKKIFRNQQLLLVAVPKSKLAWANKVFNTSVPSTHFTEFKVIVLLLVFTKLAKHP